MPLAPQSLDDFNLVMNEIEEVLRGKDIPIHNRSIHAASEYSRRYGLSLVYKAGANGTLGNFSDENAGHHISNWYKARFGDREKVFQGVAKSIVSIRGDLWEIAIPRILGQARFFINRDLNYNVTNGQFGTEGRAAEKNVLTLIHEMPQGLAFELTDDECITIFTIFQRLLKGFYAIEEICGRPYSQEILADLTAAVNHLRSNPPHFGQSKWSSSQASEKLIKSLLKVKQVNFTKTHNLENLSRLAETLGTKFEPAIISKVQAEAGARYGETIVNKTEALQAHYASLEIAILVSETFARPSLTMVCS
jgi:HEPN domain